MAHSGGNVAVVRHVVRIITPLGIGVTYAISTTRKGHRFPVCRQRLIIGQVLHNIDVVVSTPTKNLTNGTRPSQPSLKHDTRSHLISTSISRRGRVGQKICSENPCGATYRGPSEIIVCLSVEVRETRIVINQVSRSGGVITEPVCIHHWLDPPPTRDGSLCNLSWEISQTCQTPFSGKKIRDLLLFISGVSMFVSPSLL